MGQCPITVPSDPDLGNNQHAGADADDMSIGTNGSKSSIRTITIDDEEEFLRVHTAENQDNWILEPDEVYQILELQGKELMQREQGEKATDQMKAHAYAQASSIVGISNNDDANSAITNSSSVLGPARTEVTTATTYAPTDVTRKVTNSDRYASRGKRRFRGRKTATTKTIVAIDNKQSKDEGDWDTSVPDEAANNSHRPETNEPIATPQTMEKPRGILGMYSRKFQSRHNDGDEEEEVEVQKKSMPPMAACAPLMLFFASDAHPINREQSRHFSVLRLEMKAHFSDFYLRKFLPLFPDMPTPKGMTSRKPPSSPSSAKVSWKQLKEKQEESPGTPQSTTTESTVSLSTPERLFKTSPSEPINLALDGSSFLDLAVTGSLGLVDRTRSKDNGNNSSPYRDDNVERKSPLHYVILNHRASGTPIAVCALKSTFGEPVVRIYATKPCWFGQTPAATTSDLGLSTSPSLPLYGWAEIVCEGEFPMPVKYSIYLSTGSDKKFESRPTYRGSHVAVGSPDIILARRTQTRGPYKGCCELRIKSHADKENPPVFSIQIARGVDPALFICFASVVDEILEHQMKRQCSLLKKKLQKKNSRTSRSGGKLRNKSEEEKNQRYH
jgi:hypothetical protein